MVTLISRNCYNKLQTYLLCMEYRLTICSKLCLYYVFLDHVTQDKLERVLAMIQGANQKALIT